MVLYLACICAFFVAFFLARHFIRPDSRLHIPDQPNHRSLHVVPVSRSGGIAVLAGILPGGLIAAAFYPLPFQLAGIVPGLLLVAGIGLLDDFSDVRVRYRLLMQLLAAALLVGVGWVPEHLAYPGGSLAVPGVIGGVLAVLFIVWMVNLYNFMDGMDGLSGSMAFIGFGIFAVLGWLADDALFLALNGVIAAAALGFLLWNRPPAQIFLGDAGAYGLGFLAAAMMLWADRSAIFPFWMGVLIFSPFIADATVTLFVRLLRGENVGEAHREHGYQQLVQSGWGHGRTLRFYLLLMLAAGACAVVSDRLPVLVQWGILVFWVFFYPALFWLLRKWGYNRRLDAHT